MKLFLVFCFGVFVGGFLYGPKAKERGFIVGKFIREKVLRLEPLDYKD